jgi:hypothetical protein
MDRALAVEVEARGTVTTQLAASIGVALGPPYVLNSGGNVGTLSPPEWWVLPFSDGAQCEDALGGDPAVLWRDSAPSSERYFDFYLIVPNAITPNDAAGDQSVAHYLAFRPAFTVNTPVPDEAPIGGTVARCNGTQGTYALPWYMPADYQRAVSAGCKVQRP